MLPCPTCGGEDVALVERRGHLEVHRCRRCGAEQAGTAIYPDDVPAYLYVGVRLRAKWRGEVPSWSEIVALRCLVPELADRSVTDLAAHLRAVGDFVTEPLATTVANQLIVDAKARGLVLERTDAPVCIEHGASDSERTS
jgi:hypothetical protein